MNNPNGKSLGTTALLGRFSLALVWMLLNISATSMAATQPNVVIQWNSTIVQGIRDAKLGAPVVARAMAQSAMGQI